MSKVDLEVTSLSRNSEGDYGRSSLIKQETVLSSHDGHSNRQKSTSYGTSHHNIDSKNGGWSSHATLAITSQDANGNPRYPHKGGLNTECLYPEEIRGIDKSARRKLIVATSLCLCFMTGEIIGGFLAGSLAIISDGIHLLTDFVSFIIAVIALHLAHRPPTGKLNFGWHRIEILGAFSSILLLWILTGVMCYSAVLRIESGEYEIESEIMLITAATGVFFNVVLATVLNEDLDKILNEDDEDGGGKSEKSPLLYQEEGANLDDMTKIKKMKKKGNINLKAAFIHVLGDLCQSIGVLVAAYIIYLKPEWKIADPICTFSFSFFVMFTTITIMRDIIVVLMEATPRDFDVASLKTNLLNIRGVVGVHSLRVWSVTLDKHAINAHVSIVPDINHWDVLDEAYRIAKEDFNAYNACIQLECPANRKLEDLDVSCSSA